MGCSHNLAPLLNVCEPSSHQKLDLGNTVRSKEVF